MNKNDFLNIKFFIKVLKIFAILLFPVCIFLSIKWCSMPVVFLPYGISKFFLQPENVDSSTQSLVTGYVSGYIVYLLTVAIPTVIKNRPMRQEVSKTLVTVYYKTVFLLLSMCKNACSKEQWNDILQKNDLDCFNDAYFERMQFFDCKAKAETLICYKKTNESLNWLEYLSYECNYVYELLNESFLQFHSYLDDDMLKLIMELKKSKFICIFAEKPIDSLFTLIGEDGHLYFNSVAIPMFYEQKGNLSPIFSKSDLNDNCDILREYIEILKKLYQFLEKNYKVVSIEKDYAVKKLSDDKAGHFNTASINSPEKPVKTVEQPTVGNKIKIEIKLLQ